MNKLPLSIVIFVMIVSAVVASPFPLMMPAPISGTVTIDGIPVNGFKVQVTNLDTGEMLTVREVPTLRTENGKYMFDLSDFKDGVALPFRESPGDRLQIVACNLDDACTYTFEVVSTTPKTVDFDVLDAEPLEPIDPQPCPVCEECPSCPSCPTCQECPSCPDEQCPACPVCPGNVDDIDWGLIVIATLAGLGVGGAGGFIVKRKEAMSKGVGLKIYTKTDGTQTVLHKHPGIVGYHDPMIVHRDINDRHEKGELTPAYDKSPSGVWIYRK